MKKVTLLAVLFCVMLSSSLAFAGAKRVNVHMAFGTDVLIITNQTVSLRGQCVLIDGFGDSRVSLYATTTSPTGTVLEGTDTFNGTNRNFLSPSTLPEDARLISNSALVGEVNWDNDTSEGFVLDTFNLGSSNKPPGLAVVGDTAILGLTGDGCYISVVIEKIKKFKTM